MVACNEISGSSAWRHATRISTQGSKQHNQIVHTTLKRKLSLLASISNFQLWLSLADKYLKSKNVDWAKEEEKCFCEKWREDDEELGIQIVKVISVY